MSAERIAEERIGRDRASDCRRCASSLAAGERQSLLDGQDDPEPRTRASQDFGCGDGGCVPRRISREIGMAGIVDAHADLIGQSRANRVPESSQRAAEDVQARADVAGAAGRERAHDATGLERRRRSERGRG